MAGLSPGYHPWQCFLVLRIAIGLPLGWLGQIVVDPELHGDFRPLVLAIRPAASTLLWHMSGCDSSRRLQMTQKCVKHDEMIRTQAVQLSDIFTFLQLAQLLLKPLKEAPVKASIGLIPVFHGY